MLRILLLLIGTNTARRLWPLFLIVGTLIAVLGGMLFADALDGTVNFAMRPFGGLLIAIGVVILLGSSLATGMARRLRWLRALVVIVVGVFLVDPRPHDAVVLSLVLGAAYALDGIFRITAAVIVRQPQWGRTMAVGIFELALAAFFLEPYPTHYAGTVAEAVGMGLMLTGLFEVRLGIGLLLLPPRATLPLLLSGGYQPTTAPPDDKPAGETGDVTVHVWTPTGSVTNPQHQLVIDRYIGARDQEGVISTGHAALQGPGDLYISHYPAVEIDRSPSEFIRTFRATSENDVEAKFQPSYEEEAAGWMESNVKVVFRDVNVVRLRQFWRIYQEEDVYNLTRRNCSSTTVVALETALEGRLTRGGFHIGKFLQAMFSPELWVAAKVHARAEAMAWTPGFALDYTRAMFGILHPPDMSWSRQVQRARVGLRSVRDHQREAEPVFEPLPVADEAEPAKGSLVSTAAVIGSAAIFGLTYGLSAPLIADDLTNLGYSKVFIGLNAAMHAVGVLIIAPFLPQLAGRFGSRRLMIAALATTALLMALLPHLPSIWLWFVFRLGLGMCAEVLFVMSESWANDLSTERSRGKVMAIYTAAMSLGFAGGPALLSVVGSHQLAYGLGAFFAIAAAAPLLVRKVVTPVMAAHSSRSPLHYARLAPVAAATAMLNAAVETAGLSFVALYAMHLGFSEKGALRLISTLLVGAIVLQLPIGWLADKMERKRLIVVLALLSALSAFAWPWTLRNPSLAYVIIFVWGGLFVGIYTVMLAMVGSRFRGSELVGVYSVMSVAWGVGALIGPTVVGIAMSASPMFGLPWAIGGGCALFALRALLSRKGAL